jgi:S-adenosylmethionine:tRNA ribosyltransferase-isomerase
LHVYNLPTLLNSSDVLVINNTKVFNARLKPRIVHNNTERFVELFVIKPVENYWLCIGKPGKKIQEGTVFSLQEDKHASVTKKYSDGTFLVDFSLSKDEVIAYCNTHGSVPIPPYIKSQPKANTYQTIYAKYFGSVAAPTAGFHLTSEIIEQIKAKGIQIVEITLHVGLGTFLPIKTKTIEEHTMHSEWVSVSAQAAKIITEAKKEGRRIVAIGTTTVRTLEGVAAMNNGILRPYEGEINIFIKEGFAFSIVSALLTNFHLPESTLLILIYALIKNRTLAKEAYEQAVQNRYRFFSFGDAMFID